MSCSTSTPSTKRMAYYISSCARVPNELESSLEQGMLKVIYDSSLETNNSSFVTRVRDIKLGFTPEVWNIKLAFIERAYRIEYNSWQSLSKMLDSSPPLSLDATTKAPFKALVLPPASLSPSTRVATKKMKVISTRVSKRSRQAAASRAHPLKRGRVLCIR